jgi:hypothetical protein
MRDFSYEMSNNVRFLFHAPLTLSFTLSMYALV